MSDPFRIEGPAVVSFSGGRTSAYMLRRILDRGIQPDVHVLFANTGKEREETLSFVQSASVRWNVPVTWLERAPGGGFVEVCFQSASRAGEPFEQLITERRSLPGAALRWCTQELKIRVMRDWCRAQGWEHWDMVLGIRADEPRRVAKLRPSPPERWEHVLPLADAGITVHDVRKFWEAQHFDLQLRDWEGNCDVCHLKSSAKRARIMSDRPDLAQWWIDMEERLQQRFRPDSPNYAALLDATRRQLRLLDVDGVGDCLCAEGTEPQAEREGRP